MTDKTIRDKLTSRHTALNLQESISQAMHSAHFNQLNPSITEDYAESLFEAIDAHIRQLLKEEKRHD